MVNLSLIKRQKKSAKNLFFVDPVTGKYSNVPLVCSNSHDDEDIGSLRGQKCVSIRDELCPAEHFLVRQTM